VDLMERVDRVDQVAQVAQVAQVDQVDLMGRTALAVPADRMVRAAHRAVNGRATERR